MGNSSVLALPALDYEAAACLEVTLEELLGLAATSSAVFARLEARMAAELARIEGLNARIAASREKVQQIAQNTSRATTVFASARYPVPSRSPLNAFPSESENRLAPAIHGARTQQEAQLRERLGGSPDEAALTLAQHRDVFPAEPLPRNTTWLQELAPMYLGLRSGVARDLAPPAGHGLGPIPEDLSSISTLLLFNSHENPWIKYSAAIDNLDCLADAAHRTRPEDGDDGEETRAAGMSLAAAPTTLAEHATLPTVTTYDVAYKPKMKAMRELALPSNLNLPDIADISFSTTGASDESIAPSLRNASLPDIPQSLSFAPNPASGPAPVAPPPPPPPPSPTAAATTTATVFFCSAPFLRSLTSRPAPVSGRC